MRFIKRRFRFLIEAFAHSCFAKWQRLRSRTGQKVLCEPYKALEKSRAWGERIHVKHTPTVVLDGNLLVSNLNIDNLRTLINGILKKDKTP